MSKTHPSMTIVPADSILSQPWWPALHSTIIAGFKTTNTKAYPPTWTRLPQDPDKAAQQLTGELGSNGLLAVVLLDDHPIACTGALPFRGTNWIKNEKSADGHNATLTRDQNARAAALASSSDWEICCFCVDPAHRGKGVSPKLLNAMMNHLKGLGAKRLYANYAIEETGNFWSHMGFEVMPGAGGILKKGFTLKAGTPGLLEDIHFAMAMKTL